jgi:hypothetical protein
LFSCSWVVKSTSSKEGAGGRGSLGFWRKRGYFVLFVTGGVMLSFALLFFAPVVWGMDV